MAYPVSNVYVMLVSEDFPDSPSMASLPVLKNTINVSIQMVDVTVTNPHHLRGRTVLSTILLNGLTEERLKDCYPETYSTLRNTMRTLNGKFIESPTHNLLRHLAYTA